jgi:hypothetical protein
MQQQMGSVAREQFAVKAGWPAMMWALAREGKLKTATPRAVSLCVSECVHRQSEPGS